MYASNYFEDIMLNLLKSQTPPTAPSNLYLALFQNNPGDTGVAGTEIAYTGYARQLITFTAPEASGAGLSMQNEAMITFPEAPATAGSVQYVAVFDNISGGNMFLYGQLDQALNIQAGVSPVFRAGSVKWIWTGNLTTYYRTAIMNYLRGTNLSGFAPYVGFCNGDPTGSGNEFSGNNYARVAVTFSTPAQQPSGTDHVQNTTDILSGVATGNWGTLNTVAIFDAASAGNCFAVISLETSYNVTSGYAVGFHAGDLQFNVN